MGYSTTFTGKMTLTPELTPAQMFIINEFCDDRHSRVKDGDKDRQADNFQASYAPSLHCDWETDGKKLYWNGSEKSYEMDEWLRVLIARFFKPWGVQVSGKMLAEGQRRDDRWTMQVGEGQAVFVETLHMSDLGITE